MDNDMKNIMDLFFGPDGMSQEEYRRQLQKVEDMLKCKNKDAE